MSLCIQCGYSTSGPDDMCVHHVASYADDWAMGNGIMCDFLHRGIVSPRPGRRAATLTILTRFEPAREWDA